MVCQVCKQRKATTHLKRVINGKAFEAYVCNQCAAQHSADVLDMSALSIGSLFGGLFSGPVWREHNTTTRCTTCSKSFQDIVDSGYVGCADCYTAFYDRLLPSIQRIHGKTNHVGKSAQPKMASEEETAINEVERLKAELQSAIDAQEYERCVEIRDQIKQLEGEGACE